MDWKLVVFLVVGLVVIWRVVAGHVREKAYVARILADVKAGLLPNGPLEEIRRGALGHVGPTAVCVL